MIELLVNAVTDGIISTINLTKKALKNKTDDKFNQQQLEEFFIAIDLKNKNLVENAVPRIIEILEQTTKLDKFILSNPYLKLCNFQEKEEQFKSYLESQLVKFEYDYKNKNIIVTSYKELMKNFYNFKYIKCFDDEFFGGYNLFEEECIFNLRRNMLISGSVGQGKTSTVQGILLNRLWNNRNNENVVGTDINIIDLKGTDLVYFKDIEEVENIAIDIEQAKELLLKLKEEMQNRNKIFRDKEVSSIEDYNEISKVKMRYKYLVIDELATFQELEKKEKEEINNIFLTLASKSRSSGIIIIGATQRPDSKTLDSFIKAQLSGTVIGHKVNNKYTSEIIINKEGLECLTHPGQAIVIECGEEMTQFPFLSIKELKARIKKDL